jgi:hypothetical protein
MEIFAKDALPIMLTNDLMGRDAACHEDTFVCQYGNQSCDGEQPKRGICSDTMSYVLMDWLRHVISHPSYVYPCHL